jgi:predicted transcriptional regulator
MNKNMTIAQKIQLKHKSLKNFSKIHNIPNGSLSSVLLGKCKSQPCVNVLIKTGFISSIKDLPTVITRKKKIKNTKLKNLIKHKYRTLANYCEINNLTPGLLTKVLQGTSNSRKEINALIKDKLITSDENLRNILRLEKKNVKIFTNEYKGTTLKERIQHKFDSLKNYSSEKGIHPTSLSATLKGNYNSPSIINALIEDNFISSYENLQEILKLEKTFPKTTSEKIAKEWGSVTRFAELTNVHIGTLTNVLSGEGKNKECIEALIENDYIKSYKDLRNELTKGPKKEKKGNKIKKCYFFIDDKEKKYLINALYNYRNNNKKITNKKQLKTEASDCIVKKLDTMTKLFEEHISNKKK